MPSFKMAVPLLCSALLLSGCYLRKDEEEKFPDEFAQGLDYADESKIDYVEMDNGEDELSFDNQDQGDLIAKANTGRSRADDTASLSPAAGQGGPSIWESPGTSSSWDSPSEEPVDASEPEPFRFGADDQGLASDTSEVPIAGAPIGGGVVPPAREKTAPQSQSKATASPVDSSLSESPSSDLDFSVDFDNPSMRSSKSGMSFPDPARKLADTKSDYEDMVSPYRKQADSFSTDQFKQEARSSFDQSVDDISNSVDSQFNSTRSEIEQGASQSFDGSRAAQAIASTATVTPRPNSNLDESLDSRVATANRIPQNRNISIESVPPPDSVGGVDTEVDEVGSPKSSMRAGATATQPSADLPDPKTLKQRGIDAYHAHDFDAAVTAFRDYLSAYTEEEDAVRAWLGYALMQDRRYGEASKEFTTLLNSANPELRADAHYYLGSIYDKQGNFEAAKVRWEQVVENYPNTKAAEKARKSLSQTSP
ncbi:MAG: tetratricopeptide repeat protein [Candidatus Omnitrophica bacterium]|nr:tetratricopeptide repeat protein [Candidatus Omnitrophota bacterium]